MQKANDWLIANGVEDLMEQGVAALVASKPEYPALFLSQFYKEMHDSQVGQKAKGPKRGINISITVPDETPEIMNAGSLAVLLRRPNDSLTVVDVRSDANGGAIKNSVHIPTDLILADPAHYAARFAKKDVLVFVSAKSPDLDVTAAVPIMQQLHHIRATTGQRTPSVYILVDGVAGWMGMYGADEQLSTDFKPSAYGTSRLYVNRRGSIKQNLRVDVPQAPSALTCSSLQVILEEGHAETVVVDVRYSAEGGIIPGSIHVPHHQIVSNPVYYAQQWGSLNTVIFVSHMSPDLDLTAATAFMQANNDMGGCASVFTLVGGLKGWVPTHRYNGKLVTHYDPEMWDANALDVPVAKARGMGAPALKARRGSDINVMIDLPEVPNKMGGQELAALLKGSWGSPRRAIRYLVIDVRANRDGGHITDSLYVPHEQLLANVHKYAEEWSTLSSLIFYSNVSPDLDENVATATLNALRDQKSDTEVFCLLGGFRGWVANCYDNPILVSEFDAAKWPDIKLRCNSFKKPKGRPALGITVPEPPLKMSPQELALLVKAKSDALVIVDVRDTREGGAIRGSVHIPAHTLSADLDRYVGEWQGKDMLVFVSQQPYDLDVSAATPMLQGLRAVDSQAQVFILLGGMHSWLSYYRDDAELIEE